MQALKDFATKQEAIDYNGVYYKRVAGFPAISTAGVYHTQCPQLNNLYVDDAYGLSV